MKIRGVYVRRFRSIRSAEITGCGGLNVLIGKNNSGKSTFLAAIELIQRHLLKAQISGLWATTRPADEFTDRELGKPLQIGIEFELSPSVNATLRSRLQDEVPQLERPIEQLKNHSQIAFVVAGVAQDQRAFLFIQHIAAGRIKADGDDLSVEGINLLTVTQPVASELFAYDRAIASAKSEVHHLERGLSEVHGRTEQFFGNREMSRYLMQELFGSEVSVSLQREVMPIIRSVTSREEFNTRISGLIAERRSRIDNLEHKETDGTIATFAGASKSPPNYAMWLAKEFGAIRMLHLRETRERIGKDEAQELLSLKVTRGGPERLLTLQRTVKSLLGVEVDAFQSEEFRRDRDRAAEMDIDRFLVDANGAGVREALRMILDIELKKPQLVLIEEPEVHLHPGLEHAVHGFLRGQSRDTQLFLTTHSTNFVDSVSFQNIYLVSKSAQTGTTCQRLDAGDGALKIPAELGLRLSSVFMFDRLVFVEGPSDEAVLRDFCAKLDLDLAKANVGFVQMGGVRNFAHFAAQATLELLAHRQIKMWFVADRDERDDEEVQQMLARLGQYAHLKVLDRRELENYLLDANAMREFIADRRQSSVTGELPTTSAIAGTIADVARDLKDEVIRLRMGRTVLAPLYLQNRTVSGTFEQRIDSAIEQLKGRKDALELTRDQVKAECELDWETAAPLRAPGSLVLQKTLERFGARFRKDEGDSARLARFIAPEAIPEEIRNLLRQITGVH